MKNSIYQVSPLNLIVSGNYERMTSFNDLPKNCNIGLGTFENLDGEMVLLDSKFYQFKSDGKCYNVDMNQGTPFATIANFIPQIEKNISPKLNFSQFTSYISSALPEENVPIIIRFDGHFEMVHFRSVPRQEKPFPSLSEVAKHQPEFTKENVNGTLVGFRFPPYFSQFNSPGYHLHFVNNEKTFGGHVLDLSVENGKLQLSECQDFSIHLPANVRSFRTTDLNTDRTKETAEIEGHKHD